MNCNRIAFHLRNKLFASNCQIIQFQQLNRNERFNLYTYKSSTQNNLLIKRKELTNNLFISTRLFSNSIMKYEKTNTDQQTTVTNEPIIQLTEIEKRQAKLAQEQLNQLLSEKVVEQKPVEKKENSFLDPYIRLMRLDKPAPIYLTYWPSAWAILGAASYQHAAMPDFYLLGLFALGAMTMRSAGCIINDIWDRKLDQKVERTKTRPLASGQISLPSAYLLLLGNLSVSLSILFQLNLTTQLLGACCLFPVAIYPAAKRFTNWPQAVLGVTFNWGALMGWSAVICSTASQSQTLLTFLPALFLYAGAINWTLFYDTIYAFQDKDCDIKNGIRSTAIHLQKRPKLWLLGFSSLFASNLAVFGWLTSQEPIYYMAIGLAFAHTLKQLALVKLNSPESCQKQFKSNNTIGALITFGLLASIFIK